MRQGLYQPGGQWKSVRRRIKADRDRHRPGPGTKLSVFDEPEAGIDLWSFQNLIQVFEKMRETTNGSIVIISHQERILEIADEIVVISDGSILKHGTRDEILPEILGTASAPSGCQFYRRRHKHG